MNHDGTMAHSLVDAPKKFNRSDLKEINSEKSRKKHHIKNQSDRSFNKTNLEQSDEDNSFSSSEIVPYFERNNSSKTVMEGVDKDSQYLDKRFDEDHDSIEKNSSDSDPDSRKLEVNNNKPAESQSEQSVAGETIHGVGLENEDDSLQLKTQSFACRGAEKVKSESKEESQEDVTLKEMNESQDAEKKDSVMQLLNSLLEKVSKDDLEKHLRGEKADAIEKVSSQLTTDPSASEQKFQEINYEFEQLVRQDEGENRDSASCDPGSDNQIPMEEAMVILKRTMDEVVKETQGAGVTDSQKLLTVTALKVAGESMTAAAKMADALTILVQSSKNRAHPSLLHNSVKFKRSNCKKRQTKRHYDNDSGSSPQPCRKHRGPDCDVCTPQKTDELETDASCDEQPAREGWPNEDVLESKSKRRGSRHDYDPAQFDEPNRRSKSKSSHPHHARTSSKSKKSNDDFIAENARQQQKSRSKSRRRDESERKQRWGEGKPLNDVESYWLAHKTNEQQRHTIDVPPRHGKGMGYYGDGKVEQKSKTPSCKKRQSRTHRTVQQDINDCVTSPDYSMADGQGGNGHEIESNNSRINNEFEASAPWQLVERSAPNEVYFGQVVRRLKSCSPEITECHTRDLQSDWIRAKLVGSCVDPNVRDSDFDSIEFNGNARMSFSTLVNFDADDGDDDYDYDASRTGGYQQNRNRY